LGTFYINSHAIYF